MSKQIDALKLAFEAFTIVRFCVPPAQRPTIERAIAAIKEALAQPEQEPVAWVHEEEIEELKECNGMSLWAENAATHTEDSISKQLKPSGYVPLYTTPPQRKPLTDEMVLVGGKALAKRHADSCGLDFDDVWKFYADEHKDDAKAVLEAAHGIKE